MRLLLIALITLLSITSCTTIEENSPALQGLNNNLLFKATTSRAVFNPDGSLVIRGENGSGEAVNFLVATQGISQVTLGGSPSNQNVAVYTDNSGNQFSTRFEDATGVLNYTLNGSESVSGDFKFTAFTPGKTDTVFFSKGFIFEVPFVSSVPIDIPDTSLQDQFSARINTTIFSPTIIAETVSGGILTLSGQTSTMNITIVLPVNSTPGDYEMLGGTPVFGSFTNESSVNVSTSGILKVISNDTTENIMVGEFAFETAEGFSITDGTFTINY